MHITDPSLVYNSCTTVEECDEWTVGKIVVYQLQ